MSKQLWEKQLTWGIEWDHYVQTSLHAKPLIKWIPAILAICLNRSKIVLKSLFVQTSEDSLWLVVWEGKVAEFGVWSLVINQGAAIGEAVFSRLASIDTVCGPLHPLPAFHPCLSPRAASRSLPKHGGRRILSHLWPSDAIVHRLDIAVRIHCGTCTSHDRASKADRG